MVQVTNSYSEPVSGRRNRRQSTDETPLQRELSACGANQCTVIKCKTAPITTNSRIVFKMRSRIWVQTISEVNTQFNPLGRNNSLIAIK